MYLIGVDGGGTHSRLTLADEQGHILGKADCGGINFNAIGMSAARKNLFDAVDALLADHGATVADCAMLAIGSAALDTLADEALVREFCGDRFDPVRCLLDSDVSVSLYAATGGKPGILLIAGTGSMGAAFDAEGRQHIAGGWGYLLGDSGSGFDIGRRALLAAAEAEDYGRQTLLRAIFCEHFGTPTLRDAIPIIYAEDFKPADIAALSAGTDRAAQQGDELAVEVIETAAYSSAELCACLHKRSGAEHVAVYGGVFEHSVRYNEAFRAALAALGCGHLAVELLATPPQIGALMMGAKALGILDDTFRENVLKK